MGSLNYDGTPINKSNNTSSFKHLGHVIEEIRSQDDTVVSTASVTGEANLDGAYVSGVAFKSPTNFVHVSGMSLALKSADTSVELPIYTVDGSATGDLSWQVVRHMGIHTSVSERRQPPTSSSKTRTVSEEKIFFLDSDRNKSSGFADWTIFDSSGEPVGAETGVTRIDVTPSGTFNNTSGETPV